MRSGSKDRGIGHTGRLTASSAPLGYWIWNPKWFTIKSYRHTFTRYTVTAETGWESIKVFIEDQQAGGDSPVTQIASRE